jgi:hypothetical protein
VVERQSKKKVECLSEHEFHWYHLQNRSLTWWLLALLFSGGAPSARLRVLVRRLPSSDSQQRFRELFLEAATPVSPPTALVLAMSLQSFAMVALTTTALVVPAQTVAVMVMQPSSVLTELAVTWLVAAPLVMMAPTTMTS